MRVTGGEMMHSVHDSIAGQAMRALLHRIPLFAGLPDEQLDHLARMAVRRQVPRHKTIVFVGAETDCLFVIVSGSAVFTNLLLFAAILFVFGLLGHIPGLVILWLPFLMLLTLALAIGLGLSLGVINVFMRDIGQVMPIVLQFWFWLTPVVYTLHMFPDMAREWFMLNPMTGIVMGYQNVLVYDKAPELGVLLYPALLALAALALALFLYRRAGEDMADVL